MLNERHNRMSLPRALVTSIVFVIVAGVRTLLASTPEMDPILPTMPAEIEAQRTRLRLAPIHVQAIITSAPLRVGFGHAGCTVEASVVRSFTGLSILPISLFRVYLPCSSSQDGSRFLPPPWHFDDTRRIGFADSSQIKGGAYFEAFLTHYGPQRGYRLAGYPTEMSDAPEERYNFIPAPSVSPQLRIPEQPPAAQTGLVHFLEPSDPSGDLPPVFPKRIIVQTVMFSRKPDRQYRIYYDPATWRTRVEELDEDGAPTGKLDFGDAFADYELSADDRTHEVVYDHVWRSWAGPGWLGRLPVTDLDISKPVAAKIIAGVTCEVYELVNKYGRSGKTPGSDDDFCVTPDGVNLELHSQTGRAPAFTTVQLTYPTNLPLDLFDAPAGWRLKLDPQDVHH